MMQHANTLYWLSDVKIWYTDDTYPDIDSASDNIKHIVLCTNVNPGMDTLST